MRKGRTCCSPSNHVSEIGSRSNIDQEGPPAKETNDRPRHLHLLEDLHANRWRPTYEQNAMCRSRGEFTGGQPFLNKSIKVIDEAEVQDKVLDPSIAWWLVQFKHLKCYSPTAWQKEPPSWSVNSYLSLELRPIYRIGASNWMDYPLIINLSNQKRATWPSPTQQPRSRTQRSFLLEPLGEI